MSRLPRWVHCVFAAVAGYFWLPCPNCDRMFGGHEWKDRGSNSGTLHWAVTSSGVVRGVALCPACTRAGVGGRSGVAS